MILTRIKIERAVIFIKYIGPMMENYLSKRSLIKHTCSRRDKLISASNHMKREIWDKFTEFTLLKF